MRKNFLSLFSVLAVLAGAVFAMSRSSASKTEASTGSPADVYQQRFVMDEGFSVEVLVDGRPIPEYAGRGKRYVEALENAEYELRIHNPLATRVAVALSVDGLNTIDARHTSAWDAHKWVIDPNGTIYVRGWQMSSDNARRFYFTTERNSYGAKLGQTANLGVIAAVFFRERQPIVIQPVTPRPRPPYDEKDKSRSERGAGAQAPSANSTGETAKSLPYPIPDDESAATGIGRSVRNDVQWIKMDLDPRPAADITIRYEYRDALVRLGIVPREPKPYALDRRERAKGFEPQYCPQP